MRVVIAPDKFKGTVTAPRAAELIGEGWRNARPDDDVVLCPMADGGDGTASVLAAALSGSEWVTTPAVDAVGRPKQASWLRAGPLAIVELALVCGLAELERPDPLGATTRGLGIVLAAALSSGADRVLVALGGSASTDGGTGALAELLPRDQYPGVEVEVLVDVDSPLLGPSGAARVFAPQKGATPEQVDELEARLETLAALMGGNPRAPGTGAAGGTGYGLACWGARLVPGAAAVGEVVGLPRLLAEADVVITGEGRFDETSLRGKTCGQVLSLAGRARPFVIAGSAHFAGSESALPAGVRIVRLDELAGSIESAMSGAEAFLVASGERAARALAD